MELAPFCFVATVER